MRPSGRAAKWESAKRESAKRESAKRESGQVGEQPSGRAAKWESGQAGERPSGSAAKPGVVRSIRNALAVLLKTCRPKSTALARGCRVARTHAAIVLPVA